MDLHKVWSGSWNYNHMVNIFSDTTKCNENLQNKIKSSMTILNNMFHLRLRLLTLIRASKSKNLMLQNSTQDNSFINDNPYRYIRLLQGCSIEDATQGKKNRVYKKRIFPYYFGEKNSYTIFGGVPSPIYQFEKYDSFQLLSRIISFKGLSQYNNENIPQPLKKYTFTNLEDFIEKDSKKKNEINDFFRGKRNISLDTNRSRATRNVLSKSIHLFVEKELFFSFQIKKKDDENIMVNLSQLGHLISKKELISVIEEIQQETVSLLTFSNGIWICNDVNKIFKMVKSVWHRQVVKQFWLSSRTLEMENIMKLVTKKFIEFNKNFYELQDDGLIVPMLNKNMKSLKNPSYEISNFQIQKIQNLNFQNSKFKKSKIQNLDSQNLKIQNLSQKKKKNSETQEVLKKEKPIEEYEPIAHRTRLKLLNKKKKYIKK
jgi:hypothetical protein